MCLSSHCKHFIFKKGSYVCSKKEGLLYSKLRNKNTTTDIYIYIEGSLQKQNKQRMKLSENFFLNFKYLKN